MAEESDDDASAESAEDAAAADEIHSDPDAIDRPEKYEDRHDEALTTANPDDHRDEEPNNS